MPENKDHLHITLVVATTADGFITSQDDPLPQHWTSEEDKLHLSKIVLNYPLLVMGERTYRVHQPKNTSKHIVVLSHNTTQKIISEHADIQNLSPRQFTEKYQSFKKCLLLGGAYTYQEFLKEKLVDEAYVTVEPLFAQSGISFLQKGKKLEDYGLKLREKISLNNKGTELCYYHLI